MTAEQSREPVEPATLPLPTAAPQRGSTVRWIIMAIGVLVSGVWALRPLADPHVEPSDIGPLAPTGEPARVALDLDAFRAPLWVAPPAPPPPAPAPKPPPPPPPLKIELLAITRDENGNRAVLYDADTDRIHIVAPGDRLADRTVEQVRDDIVSIRTAHGLTTLTLRRDGGRS